jgi:hypothetical protein
MSLRTARGAIVATVTVIVLTGAGLTVVGAFAGTTPGTVSRQTAGTITVALHEVHHSGQHGSAVLTPHGKTFTVRISLSASKRFPGPYPNDHIHDVTCKQYARIKGVGAQYGTVVVPLSPIPMSLRASTNVSQPLSKYTTGHYAINVHANDAAYTTTVCGDIPKR